PSNSGGNGSSESSGSTSNTATPVTGENTVNIQVNGVNQNLATATTATVNNRTVTTVVLNDSQLNKMLAGEGNKAVITIPIINNTDVAIGQLNGQTVKNMESKEAVLQIKTENATYTLPAAQINIDAVSAQIGQDVKLSDITVSIEIAQAAEQTVKVVENAASQGNFSIVVPPVEFTVTCTYADKTVNVSQFNSYVERTIAIPDGVDPSKITTGIIVEPDGTTRHVPTQIVQIDGKYYAKINSLTNSTYSVIWNPLEFQDIAHHWAKDAVNDMGSRMVISGAGQDTFEPDRDITRAEFAAIIVRALGLKPGTGSNQFTDVSDKDWYGDYVKTASENKIISGYGDGQFGPEDRISREQAFAMIARTMDITGLKTEIAAGEADKLLTKFSDANQASDYARSSIAECLKTAIASGRNGGLIAPKDNITRAEAAVMVQKLLQKSNLI
ncbi:MAG: S-layer homology domain-containing protein, partial [Syntrophomonas sp.]